MKSYISQYGVPKTIRTDPGTVFVSDEFGKFCKQFGIKQITCPVRDHRGNGKIERLIRTINERVRANKQIVITKDKSGLSEILYALRISKKKDGKSPFEKQLGKEPNTVKSNRKIHGCSRKRSKPGIRAIGFSGRFGFNCASSRMGEMIEARELIRPQSS